MENNLENSNFKNLLYKNDQKEIQDFLLENGKEGKVFCPICFENDENWQGRRGFRFSPIYFENNEEEEDGK